MFNCSFISGGQASSYFKEDDYFAEKGTAPARFLGNAAAALGLDCEFDSKKFNAGLHGEFDFPKNKAIEAVNKVNANNNPRAAFDCVFSAPKSVSIEALVFNQKDVEQMHQEAVDYAMTIAADLIRARVRVDKVTTFEKCDIAYTNFRHKTSRNTEGEMPDPNLHDHNVIFSSVVYTDKDGVKRIYALSNEEIMKAQKMLDMVYKQQLAEKLRAAGYELELTKDGFEIAGYSKENLDQFSKRKLEVDEHLQSKGLTRETATAGQREAANLKNRQTKGDITKDAISKSWSHQARIFKQPQERKQENARSITAESARKSERDRGEARTAAAGFRQRIASDQPDTNIFRPSSQAANWGDLRHLSECNVVHDQLRSPEFLHENGLDKLVNIQTDPNNTVRRGNGETGDLTPADSINVAINHFKQRQVFVSNEYQLLEYVLKSSEFDFTYKELHDAFKEKVKSGELMYGKNGQALIIKAAYDDEKAMKELYAKSIGTSDAPATLEIAKAGIKTLEDKMTAKLTAAAEIKHGRPLFENEIAALTVKLRDKQAAMIEQITTSKNAIDIIVGDAGTGKSTGMEAAKIILESQNYTVKGLAPSATAVAALEDAGLDTKTIQHAFHNLKYWEDVDSRTVIVIDEAGLVDLETMKFVLEQAAQRGARVAIVGDPKQYDSVNRGTAMKELVEQAKAAGHLTNLDEMQRGRNEEMRTLHFAARDDAAGSLNMLFEKGMVTAVADDAKRLEIIAELYQNIDERDKNAALVLTGTNAERKEINTAIREVLGFKDGEKISTIEMLDFTQEDTKQLASYEREDFVKLNQNFGSKKDGTFIKAGTVLQVLDKTPLGLVLQDRDGNSHAIHPKDFGGSVSIGQVEQIDVCIGERVRFTANDKEKDIQNGDRGTVIKLAYGQVHIKLDRTDLIVRVNNDQTPANFRYAYAQTGHSAQGATAKMADPTGEQANVILCANAGDPTVNVKSWYTNLTRAADKVHLVTNAATARQIENIRTNLTAIKSKATAEEMLTGPKDLTKEEEAAAQEASRKAYIAPAKGDLAYQQIEIPHNATAPEILVLLKQAEQQYGKELFIGGGNKTVVDLAIKTVGNEKMFVQLDNESSEKSRIHQIIFKHGVIAAKAHAEEVLARAVAQPGGMTADDRAAAAYTRQILKAAAKVATKKAEEKAKSTAAVAAAGLLLDEQRDRDEAMAPTPTPTVDSFAQREKRKAKQAAQPQPIQNNPAKPVTPETLTPETLKVPEEPIKTPQDRLRAMVLAIDPHATFEVADPENNVKQYSGSVAASLNDQATPGFAQRTGRGVYTLHATNAPAEHNDASLDIKYRNGQATITIKTQDKDKGNQR